MTLRGGLLLSRVEDVEPDHSLAEPLLVVMAQGGKRLMLGDEGDEYRVGQCLVVTADLPVTGRFLDASRDHPSLATGDASPELLDAVTRLVRLLDHPADVPVLAALIEREILWRLLSGPHGDMIRQIGLRSREERGGVYVRTLCL
ncbi:AraC family transcriptional regulator [Streptomyces niveus]|uniref:AraC family transcriptional regulator n=1 Tax=Streptomyces niveus TaxID=193462 RepID=UPI0003C5B5BD|nr:AraC family transcriptional regulator [Streptomyces niveus]EST33011.1 hypothetical protein M877_02945 [Streptomyces niveus NCIMB 11891]